SGSQVTGAAVYVTSLGQLGVLASSERYKTDITPIGATAGKLEQLRPVSFHLKTDPTGALQYGLIAEEVFKVFPELVIRDGSGKIQGVRYEELAPMLLSEVQQQQATISAQADEIRDLKQQQQDKFAAQSDQLNQLQQQFTQLQDINRQMQGALEALQSKKSAVAMR
ncbi:MAG TPA: tail fiber domain-containing protein, partial [Steroidobacteraceae bacterium]|nr:tail fiber domain-containing protein [Steroidobacteraceae bacterium]